MARLRATEKSSPRGDFTGPAACALIIRAKVSCTRSSTSSAVEKCDTKKARSADSCGSTSSASHRASLEFVGFIGVGNACRREQGQRSKDSAPHMSGCKINDGLTNFNSWLTAHSEC